MYFINQIKTTSLPLQIMKHFILVINLLLLNLFTLYVNLIYL